ncbi:MAG: UDP-N-acetylmuramate:L-alanyl-gamma-D-glutamyl-meso-diaminopimelate ligase [Burkholderiaceae bacterium]|nr:UDP-N-acetylmuramate:L-alanyl-gamma-D-glutamyl-meso-diaminopimelate ligase [Burkholderiaceae bacterium]
MASVHIIGICGTFMGGLAAIAQQAGHRVTGCDANVYPPMSDQLRALGIELIEGFDPDQLRIRPDLWIVGNVVSRGNPLMEAILDEGLAYTSGPQWLAEHALRGRHVLAVAGTHGKTTTSAMVASILERAGRRPGFLIGGAPVDFPVSARLGEGREFVIEADEYDTAFFDKRSKFVHYRPRTVVMNNLEYDHADIFPDLAAIETQFHHLVRMVPGSGRVIRPARSEALDRVLARGLWSELETIDAGGGSSTGGWSVSAIEETADASAFDIRREGRRLGRCELRLPGEHNRANALAAVAAVCHVGVDPVAAIEALTRFGGVRRRLETRGSVGGVEVIDDFAHHPTAIETTIAGLRARLGGGGRIIAVLEPRSNTMKLGVMKTRLGAALAGADRVYCFAGGIDWDPSPELAVLGPRARVERRLEPMVAAIVADARPGDRILVMSNGGFGGVHALLLDALKSRPC